MTSASNTRLLSPEEIAVQAGQQVPFLHLPERSTVFAEREMRLRQRAVLHSMRDFLLFMAELSSIRPSRYPTRPRSMPLRGSAHHPFLQASGRATPRGGKA
jgi:formate dehydrogenase maturation protein FdhE